jgi:hypothetical protein
MKRPEADRLPGLPGRRPEAELTWRMPRWVGAFLLFVALGAAVLTAYFWRQEGLSLNSGSAAGFTLLALLGLADILTMRVSLLSDSIAITSNMRRRTYARETVEAVTWGKGVGVSVKFRNGKWMALPPVGRPLAVTNSIRAWIKRTPSSGAAGADK